MVRTYISWYFLPDLWASSKAGPPAGLPAHDNLLWGSMTLLWQFLRLWSNFDLEFVVVFWSFTSLGVTEFSCVKGSQRWKAVLLCYWPLVFLGIIGWCPWIWPICILSAVLVQSNLSWQKADTFRMNVGVLRNFLACHSFNNCLAQ